MRSISAGANQEDNADGRRGRQSVAVGAGDGFARARTIPRVYNDHDGRDHGGQRRAHSHLATHTRGGQARQSAEFSGGSYFEELRSGQL